MTNKYWNGDEHAVITAGMDMTEWNRDVANRAFCIWYHGQQTLYENIGSPHWTEMYKSMRDCGKTGWGMGVQDLDDAFKHIESNNGAFIDLDAKNYYGGSGKAYNNGIIKTVTSCANFLSAVDDKLPKLQIAMKEYQSKCQALNTLKLSKQESSWAQVKTNIDLVKKSADRVKSLLWLMPGTIETFVPAKYSTNINIRNIEDLADSASSRINKSVKFLDVLGNVHDSLTVYVEATEAFDGDERMGLCFAALSYSMTFLPVLGGFYGAMIQKIPGLVKNWKSFMADYTYRIDHPEAYLKALERKKPAWRCDICMSSGGY